MAGSASTGSTHASRSDAGGETLRDRTTEAGTLGRYIERRTATSAIEQCSYLSSTDRNCSTREKRSSVIGYVNIGASHAHTLRAWTGTRTLDEMAWRKRGLYYKSYGSAKAKPGLRDGRHVRVEDRTDMRA